MKIEDKREERQVPLGSLEEGTVVELGGILFLSTETLRENKNKTVEILVVKIEDGKCVWVVDTTLVEPIDAKLVIEGVK